ncbi:NADH-quinone oxidoreductase subunit M [Rhodothalassium salexigens]|uniref:NADH-quinone oxidoreductase subunit M n=1 Tax=Rhodothalassium salexigens TaxID=1086 RepID=UPI001913E813|nr:NADH-quinone oxidoreductase subunit M [Rhodothalassium salexigens]MBK5911667.1 NADH-quinone oxidoreductase subunit M [Rhodothalassium salexigens]
MLDWPILSVMLFVPLLGAGIILLLRGPEEIVARNIRATALYASLFTFALSVLLWINFDASQAGFQFVETYSPFGGLFQYKLGVDGISMLFVVLSAFLVPIAILASWTSIQHRVREYMVAFLILETLLIGVFSALDLVLFYLMFESSLIPMFLIIGVWGGVRRVYAAFKFFLYTFLGSVLMLVAVFYIVATTGTTDIPTLLQTHFPAEAQTWLWLAFFASFAVKMPMWPVHTWLPDAHVEAPTAGSMLLAGVLLKFGGYGFLRFSLPMFPIASVELGWLIFALSMVAIVYASLVALAQTDMKKLIAYSSVAHMGYVTIGLFVFNHQGLDGAVFQMLSHGVVSAALFLCVGVVYDRLHTREIARYGGLAHNMPAYATVFMIFTLASLGLPGTSGFVGEFLSMMGAFQRDSLIALVAALGVILGAVYMLYLYRRVFLGPLEKADLKALADLDWREKSLFVPMAAVVLWLGVFPNNVLDVMRPTVDNLLAEHEAAITAYERSIESAREAEQAAEAAAAAAGEGAE